MLYYLELAGVAVFAATGVLASRDRDLDVMGVIVVATITAIGGGTLRDVLLDRNPIFWIDNTGYLLVIIAAALATILYLRVRPEPGATLLVADALGLGLFAISGARVAEGEGLSPLIVVLMGTMTGVTGGVLRDVITARVPLILRQDIYATAAILGIVSYLALGAAGLARTWAAVSGMLVVVVLRLAAIRWGLHLPVVRKH